MTAFSIRHAWDFGGAVAGGGLGVSRGAVRVMEWGEEWIGLGLKGGVGRSGVRSGWDWVCAQK